MKGVKNKGFTLIEILVSLAILGIVLAGIYSVYNMQHKSYIVQEQVTEMQQSERIAPADDNKGYKDGRSWTFWV